MCIFPSHFLLISSFHCVYLPTGAADQSWHSPAYLLCPLLLDSMDLMNQRRLRNASSHWLSEAPTSLPVIRRYAAFHAGTHAASGTASTAPVLCGVPQRLPNTLDLRFHHSGDQDKRPACCIADYKLWHRTSRLLHYMPVFILVLWVATFTVQTAWIKYLLTALRLAHFLFLNISFRVCFYLRILLPLLCYWTYIGLLIHWLILFIYYVPIFVIDMDHMIYVLYYYYYWLCSPGFCAIDLYILNPINGLQW